MQIWEAFIPESLWMIGCRVCDGNGKLQARDWGISSFEDYKWIEWFGSISAL